MDDSFCFLLCLSIEMAPALLFFLNKLSNFVLHLEWDFTTAPFTPPFISLLRGMSGRCDRSTATGKSHNKRSNTYSSTTGSESVPKKVKTSNKMTVLNVLKQTTGTEVHQPNWIF